MAGRSEESRARSVDGNGDKDEEGDGGDGGD